MNLIGNMELLKKTYNGLLNDVAKEHNLTLNELKILLFLSSNTNDIAKNIVEGLGSTKSHVSMSLCNLEKNGYIKKVQGSNNKKENIIELTKKSFKVIEDGSKAQEQMKKIMLKGISENELNILRDVSIKMKDNLLEYSNNRKDNIYD